MSLVHLSNLQSLFQQQRDAILSFYEHFDLSQMENLIQLCMQNKGLLFFTGMGKSSIIAEKIAKTLASIGTRAFFCSAVDLLHGDIGSITEKDVVFILSKSGETKELLDLLPHLKQKKCQIITVVSEKDCTLAKDADHTIFLPVSRELCTFDLAPTISTAIQLLFGDLLAMTLMREKEMGINEYAENHPSGSIGKKITRTVRDVMRTGKDLPICLGSDKLVNVIVELSDKKSGCLLILDKDQKLMGIFTDGDLRRALQKEGSKILEKRMEILMNPFPIIVSPDQLAFEAIQKMQEKRYVTVAPVIEKNRIIGLIRMHDLVREQIGE